MKHLDMKRLVDRDTHREIADAVSAAEHRTRAEIVTVLVPASAAYGEYALLWSAVATLLATTVMLFTMQETVAPAWQPMVPYLVPMLFMALSLLFRLPPLLRRLVPRHIQQRNAGAMARVQFLEQKLHHTRGETGVLLFVSEFERYVEILVDRGVSREVPDREWLALVAAFTRRVAAGQVREGFLETIAACSTLLAAHLPPDADNPNELPNRLVVLD